MDLRELGITSNHIIRNPTPAQLVEDAIAQGDGQLTDHGALAVLSGAKTGRSPRDKRVVDLPAIHDDIWWGPVNIPLARESFLAVRQQAIAGLNRKLRLYAIDGFAGWDPRHRLKVRVICSRPYHALFMHNMLMRPTAEELATFGTPDYVIFNAGDEPADPATPGVTSETSVALDLELRQLVILGTEYAGEMKKCVFTVMNYLMPKAGVLSMHCSANAGKGDDVTLFFGLSGTGKTTLSADPRRDLIGDDEHCWTDDGVFNIEGGCYAKCVKLSREKEPTIYAAVRFGSVLENVVVDPHTRAVDFDDISLTENTRVAYPIEFIPHARIPCLGGHPRQILLLTCDAFGVLPPVSRLTPAQVMYHFVSGYSAKVAGTEMGVTEPAATFSACFGAPFMVWHPTVYAELLAEKMHRHAAEAWLVNTGWTGGPHGVGRRINLAHTRAIIDAIHAGTLGSAATQEDPIFGLAVPTACPGVPKEILIPRNTWTDPAAYDRAAEKLARLFHDNFAQYLDHASPETAAAGPRVGTTAAAR